MSTAESTELDFTLKLILLITTNTSKSQSFSTSPSSKRSPTQATNGPIEFAETSANCFRFSLKFSSSA